MDTLPTSDPKTAIDDIEIREARRRRYRDVIDSVTHYLCRLNLSLEITMINKTYATWLGLAPREAVGQPYIPLLQRSVQKSVFNQLSSVFSGAALTSTDYRLMDARGTTCWQQWQFQAIANDVGRLSEIQCVGFDVTPMKRHAEHVETQKERYRQLAEITSDLIWEVDKHGVYTYVSPMVYEILGYGPEEVLGKRPFDFMPKEEATRLEAVFQNAVANGDALKAIENINRHKNGSLVTLETNALPILDEMGKVAGFRGVDRDISDRRFVETRLNEQRRKLKEALKDVKHLSGMLPVCASCKMVRDDQGRCRSQCASDAGSTTADGHNEHCPRWAGNLDPAKDA